MQIQGHSIAGGAVGAVVAGVTVGPVGIIPGFQAGSMIGAKIGAIGAGEKIVKDGAEKVSDATASVVNKAGEAIQNAGEGVKAAAKEFSKDMAEDLKKKSKSCCDVLTQKLEKLADVCIDGAASFARDWSATAVAIYFMNCVAYIGKEHMSLHMKDCGVDPAKNLACVLLSGNILIEHVALASLTVTLGRRIGKRINL